MEGCTRGDVKFTRIALPRGHLLRCKIKRKGHWDDIHWMQYINFLGIYSNIILRAVHISIS